MAHRDKVEGMIRNLRARTGRDLDEWMEVVGSQGPDDAKAQRAWLQQEHGLSVFTARLIVSAVQGTLER